MYVKVISYETGECAKQIGPVNERKADRVDRGLNRNLDHERYFTIIEEEETKGVAS